MKEGDRVVALESSNWFDKGEEGRVVVLSGPAALVQWKDGGGQWWALREKLEVLE